MIFHIDRGLAKASSLVALSHWVLELPRAVKRTIAVLVDATLCLLTVATAFSLRLDGWDPPTLLQSISYFGSILIAIPIFVGLGLYRAIFRHAGRGAVFSVLQACGLYAAIYATIFTLISVPEVPRSIGILQPILLGLGVLATRSFAHYFLGDGYRSQLRRRRRRVLIFGAGAAGRKLATALADSFEMKLVGFVDDDQKIQGHLLDGKRIYSADQLHDLIAHLEIDDVLLAMPSASRSRSAEIVDSLRDSAVAIRTIPGLMDLAHGRIKVQDLREVEIADLLGRETVPPNELLLSRNIVGKVVMVTGAGGSIGSELCRQIIALRPRRLILFENSEFNLYTIVQDLEKRNLCGLGNPLTELVSILGSVQDAQLIKTILNGWRPDTIYHAAAYKHVPIVEDNPAAAVLNNVRGTFVMAKQAIASGTGNFVLVSTDKAVRPTNVMGATKRLAELILQAFSAMRPATCFSIVRFGNVLGSSGSVVPLFRQQINAGGPVTLTHEDITRYFMTIPEASLLVIQAGAMASGGEVFVLDMGEPVRIVDLARRMIELSGLKVRDEARPDGDIAIECIGLRPGEKLFEELLIGDNAEPTNHPRIMMAKERYLQLEQLEPQLIELFSLAKNGEERAVVETLSRMIPESISLSAKGRSFEEFLVAS